MGFFSSFFDPGNFLGLRDGGISIAGILDPIGETVKDVTGAELPFRKDIAGFLNVPPDPIAPSAPGSLTTPLTAAQIATAKAKKDKLARYPALKARRRENIMSAALATEDTLGG